MSLRRPLLNQYLRLVGRRQMARGEPEALRRSLERSARFFFHAPRGTQQQWVKLAAGQRSIDALDVVPAKLTTDTVIFYIHGGGFVFGSPRTHAAMVAHLGYKLGARAILPRYRLSPEAPFPAAIEDVRAAWDGVLASGVAAHNIFVGGDSAGGALALGLMADLAEEQAQGPAGVFCFSPLADLTYSGESFSRNARREAVLPAERADELKAMCLAGHPAEDPRASPLFRTLAGVPPLWLTVGSTEILRDDSRRVAEKVRAQGGDVTFVEEHDLPHVWPIFHNILPEARHTLDRLATWIRQQQASQDES